MVFGYLFDSANGCGKKAFDVGEHKTGHKYYSIGLDMNKANNNHFINCDLSKKQETILQLNNLINQCVIERPDIILASPPCESGSLADTPLQPYHFNPIFKIKTIEEFRNDVIRAKRINLKTDIDSCKRYYDNKIKNGDIGKDCIETTALIINHYSPKYGVIENGAYTKIGDYICINKLFNNYNYFKNIAHYCSYGFDYRKPTAFLSNKLLDLKISKKYLSKQQIGFACNKKYEKMFSDYNTRSNIPLTLLTSIYNQLLDINTNTLFD